VGLRIFELAQEVSLSQGVVHKPQPKSLNRVVERHTCPNELAASWRGGEGYVPWRQSLARHIADFEAS
jgi:hypothetical protein